MKLLPFQKEDLAKIKDFNYRALLAWEMGLGKTIESLTVIKENDKWPVIVVCPKGLKLNWAKEARRFGLEAVLLSSKKKRHSSFYKGEKLFIINYDILLHWLPTLRALKPSTIIGDEIHAIGNLNSRRGRAFAKLSLGVPYVLGLSGTPLCNRPWELLPILRILCPDDEEFSSPFSYGHTYCEASRSFGRITFSGARNLGDLNKRLLSTCMIRRTKKEVLPQLPPKRVSVVPLEIEKREEYDFAERDLIGWLNTFNKAAAVRAMLDIRTRFTYLKGLAAWLKMPGVEEWLDEFIENSDSKILVGCIHKRVVKRLSERYNCVVIDGSKSEKQRAKAESLFRKDKKVRMLVGNIQACGMGLNLPEADTVCLAELPWTPGACQQFIDRCHRLTSKKPVFAYFMAAVGTLEEKLCEILERKEKILSKVLDGVPVREDSMSVFSELVKVMQNEKR